MGWKEGRNLCDRVVHVSHPVWIATNERPTHRYRLMVRSWRPLELVRWTHWGLRISNKEYSLETAGLNDFERHLTVMDYAGYTQAHVEEAAYMAAFERENGVAFSVVDARAEAVIKVLFEAAVPKLLEVTFGPDCAAAVKEYPDFYNQAFGVLFLNEEHADFKML